MTTGTTRPNGYELFLLYGGVTAVALAFLAAVMANTAGDLLSIGVWLWLGDRLLPLGIVMLLIVVTLRAARPTPARLARGVAKRPPSSEFPDAAMLRLAALQEQLDEATATRPD